MVATVEEDGYAVLKPFSVPDGLTKRLPHVQPLHPLDLDMYTREPHEIGGISEREGTAALDVVPVMADQIGKLPLAISPLSLG